MTNDFFVIEAKTKMEPAKSFSIKKEWMDQLALDVIGERKEYGALAFNFGGYGNTENYYIIDERAFLRFLDFLRSEAECQDI